MFTRSIPLFKLLGFQVSVDLSWLILALLITWSLAAGLFPALYPDLGQTAYWSMGVIGAIGLMFSIVIHELSHSLVSRLYGMPIKGITLFIFGGVSEMYDEPVSPKAEFLTAIVGPLTSIALAIAFYVLTLAAQATGLPATVSGLLGYLAWINAILAAFNIVPAFPLDGGRMLRAALWGWQGNYVRATRIAAGFGSAFGLLLILLAVFSVISGNFIGGMWWFLIGLFVRGAAQASYQQMMVQQTLRDVPVNRLMTRDPVAVDASLTLERMVEDFFYRHYFKSFPVVVDGRLRGIADLRDVTKVPRAEWSRRTVGDIMQSRSDENTVDPDTDAASVLKRMTQSGVPRLMVAEGDRLTGVVSQSDLLRFIAVKMDLEGEGAAAGQALGSARSHLDHRAS